MDKYTWHLVELEKLANTQLQEANAPEDPRHQWGHQLCRSISPPRPLGADGKEETPPGWPRYLFREFVLKGGEALVLRATDKQEGRDVAIKFALPKLCQRVDQAEQAPKKRVFTGAREWLLEKYESGRAKGGPRKKENHQNEDTLRFARGIAIQNQLHRAMRAKNLFAHGYIPAVYSWSEPPKLYAVMEWIEGEGIVEWCSKHSDKDVIRLFLDLLKLVETVVHNFAVVHADIAPGNLLVLNDKPVLLDFGIARMPQSDSKLTSPQTVIAKPLYAKPSQIRDFAGRHYDADIFMLAKTFWSMWHRSEPDDSDLIADYSSGFPRFDLDAIASKFDPTVFSGELRKIYERATNTEPGGGYQDVSDFRRDVELLYVREYKELGDTGRIEKPCKYVSSVYKELMRWKKAAGEVAEIIERNLS